MAQKLQSYTISHTGSVLGDDAVTRSQNTADMSTQILSWECPRQFESIRYVGERDATRFIPRSVETVTGTAADDTTVDLDTDIQPINGEPEVDEQDYPVAIAVNVTTGTEVEVTEANYSANTVTLGADAADGDTVKVYPIIAEGTIKFEGINSLGQVEGPVYPWDFPIYRFHDMNQNRAGTEVNLHGSLTFDRHEKMRVLMNSPRQIVWQDEDYPRGDYVSTLEQDVTIEL